MSCSFLNQSLESVDSFNSFNGRSIWTRCFRSSVEGSIYCNGRNNRHLDLQSAWLKSLHIRVLYFIQSELWIRRFTRIFNGTSIWYRCSRNLCEGSNYCKCCDHHQSIGYRILSETSLVAAFHRLFSQKILVVKNAYYTLRIMWNLGVVYLTTLACSPLD